MKLGQRLLKVYKDRKDKGESLVNIEDYIDYHYHEYKKLAFVCGNLILNKSKWLLSD